MKRQVLTGLKLCAQALLMFLAWHSVFAQAQNSEITATVSRDLVRFAAPGDVHEMRVEVFSQTGEKLFDSDFVTGQTQDWQLKDLQGQAVESGLYTYTVTIKDKDGSLRTQRGNVIVGRVTMEREIELTSGGIKFPDNTVQTTAANGGVAATGTKEADGSGGDTETKPESRSINKLAAAAANVAGNGTAGRIAKWSDASTITDSIAITESSSGNVGIGGAPSPGAKLEIASDAATTDVLRLRNTNATNPRSFRIGPGVGARTIFGVYDDNAAATRLAISYSGNIGIGAPDPQAKLEVRGTNADFRLDNPGQSRLTFKALAGSETEFHYNSGAGTPGLTFKNGFGAPIVKFTGDLKVGIGTTVPEEKLDVSGNAQVRGYLQLKGQNKFIEYYSPGIYAVKLSTEGSAGNYSFSVWDGSTGTRKDWLTIRNDGNVGIGGSLQFGALQSYGTLSTPGRMHVTGGELLYLLNKNGVIIGKEWGGNGNLMVQGDLTLRSSRTIIQGFDGYGHHWFGPNPDSDLAFGIRRNGPGDYNFIVNVLEITGGSDLAEPFEISGAEDLKPGMVVTIDPERPGRLRIADKAYDRTVAGIISGANGIKPGLTMKQEGSTADGSHPVALTGRVYCWADASNGPINPGDLLTTSGIPGHAMKVTDHAKAQGAIIGKAMTSLIKGRGLVLVLVTLQ